MLPHVGRIEDENGMGVPRLILARDENKSATTSGTDEFADLMDDENSGQSLTCAPLVRRYDRLQSPIHLLGDVVGTGASHKPIG